jgi:membrane-bound ClpP family serine protease
MGQIIFSRNPIGSVGVGLFLLGIAVFVYSAFDPTFRYVAVPCIAGGAVVAMLLGRRHPTVPHINPREAETLDEDSRPIEPK